MKTLKTILAFASILAATVLIMAGTTHLNDQELGIGEFNDHAMYNPRPDDQELGINEFGDHA